MYLLKLPNRSCAFKVQPHCLLTSFLQWSSFMLALPQGFASGDLDRDAQSIRMFADAGVEMLLAQVLPYGICALLQVPSRPASCHLCGFAVALCPTSCCTCTICVT